jgi:hypothetical protein
MRTMLRKLAIAVLAATAVTTAGVAGSALAAGTGLVQPTPASFTPSIATPSTDGTTEVIRELVPCGGNMYAVGKFTSIKQVSPAATVLRNNAFSFSTTTGTLTSFNPNVNGQVNSIALNTDCSIAYLGGSFTQIGTTTVKNFAAVSTSTSQVIPTVASSVSGAVQTLQLLTNTSPNHLILGGLFNGVNGSSLDKYLASVSPTTGKNDHYVHLGVSGKYSFTDQGGHSAVTNATQVYNSQLSPDGTKMLLEGDFTSVGGVQRQQIFMLDLGATSATVDPWYSTEFNAFCATIQPFYIRAAAWSADGSKVYTASTGYKPATGTGYKVSDPRAGLCDALAQFPSTATNVNHVWVNYTGCDSYYSAAEDGNAVFAAGHERWANNPNGCDVAGQGAVSDPGLAGFGITSGSVITNATNPSVGQYQRAKGLGADDMFFTSQGLWIASDNGTSSGTAQQCGGVNGHAGICLLPY